MKLIYFPSRFDSHVKVKKKGKNETAEDHFFVTVYFSHVSLGLRGECWSLTTKMTTAAKQTDSAGDSWRESDGQRSTVPQAKAQL